MLPSGFIIEKHKYQVDQILSFTQGYEPGVLSPEQLDQVFLDYWQNVCNKHKILVADMTYEIGLGRQGMQVTTKARVVEVITE